MTLTQFCVGCVFGLLTVALTETALAQVPIRAGEITLIDFNEVGSAADAALPEGVRVATLPEVRVPGTFGAAGGRTQHRGGNGLGASAPAGAYNLGSGDPSTAEDRAVGFVLGEGAQSGVLYIQCVNETGQTLEYFTYGFYKEFYRSGAGPDDAEVALEIVSLVSLDGETFSSAGFRSLVGTSDTTEGLEDAPEGDGRSGTTARPLTDLVPPGAVFYLAFQFSVSEGEEAIDLPVVGIDDIYVGPPATPFDFLFLSRLQREFDAVPVGSTSDPKPLTVNSAPRADEPPAMVVTGDHAGDFSVTLTWDFAGRYFYDVAFAPSGTGLRTAELMFYNESAETDLVVLSGIGTSSTASDEAVRDPVPLSLLQLYPNPASSSVRGTIVSDNPRTVRIEVFDILGRLVYTLPLGVVTSGNEYAFDLDASDLTPGAYTLRATDGVTSAYRPLVIAR